MSPSRTEFTNDQRRALLKFVGLNMLLTILLFLVFGLTVYQQGKADVANKRQGCERNKLDRRANATAWREAQRARTRDGDFDTALIYKSVADGLWKRAHVDCVKQFPNQSIIKVATSP